jgi:hypothetical protein
VTWPDSLAGVVTLPDGVRVRGRGLRAPAPAEDERPEVGFYLLGDPPGPLEVGDWDVRWVRWPDFRLPRSSDDAVAALVEAHRLAATTRVELACAGGTGRTGTALAILARLGGVPAGDAVAWVREHYRPRAVETPWQRRWVARTPLPR